MLKSTKDGIKSIQICIKYDKIIKLGIESTKNKIERFTFE